MSARWEWFAVHTGHLVFFGVITVVNDAVNSRPLYFVSRFVFGCHSGSLQCSQPRYASGVPAWLRPVDGLGVFEGEPRCCYHQPISPDLWRDHENGGNRACDCSGPHPLRGHYPFCVRERLSQPYGYFDSVSFQGAPERRTTTELFEIAETYAVFCISALARLNCHPRTDSPTWTSLNPRVRNPGRTLRAARWYEQNVI